MKNLLYNLKKMNLSDLKYIAIEIGISSAGNKKNIINRLIRPLNRNKYRMDNDNINNPEELSLIQQMFLTIRNNNNNPVESLHIWINNWTNNNQPLDDYWEGIFNWVLDNTSLIQSNWHWCWNNAQLFEDHPNQAINQLLELHAGGNGGGNVDGNVGSRGGESKYAE